jgi:molybdopterin-guanine dinucleotide biosynthesis protein A
MGVTKALLPYGDTTLVEHAVTVLQSAGLQVHLLANADQDFKALGVPVLIDRIPGAGPLGAIYTALCQTGAEKCFFLPCDTPLMEPSYFQTLVHLAEGFDVIVPRDSRGRIHPLCAYYGSRCLEPASLLLGSGTRTVHKLLESDELQVNFLEARKWGVSDDRFVNINSQEDYQALCRLRDRH